MAVTSGANAFNIGRDTTLTLIGPYGNVPLVNVTSFQKQQVVGQVSDTLLNGDTLNAAIPKGWNGSFSVDRGSADLDLLFGLIEAGWFITGSLANSTLYERVVETDGSVSNWMYTNVSLTLSDAGTAAADAMVKQTVSFSASRRIST